MAEPSSTARGAWQERWARLLAHITLVDSERESEALLARLTGATEPCVVAFVNAHAMNSVTASVDFTDALLASDILLRDGSGMSVLYRLLGREPGLNMNGTDFIPSVLRAFRGRTVALWGTNDPYLARARERIEEELGVVVVSTAHGFSPDEHYLALALEHRPDLIVLGMGMPKQEVVAEALRAAVSWPCVIVCGGAILDFFGGKVERAPAWMRGAGIEWLYRLALEPSRLFRRYVLGNPIFVARSIVYRIGRGS